MRNYEISIPVLYRIVGCGYIKRNEHYELGCKYVLESKIIFKKQVFPQWTSPFFTGYQLLSPGTAIQEMRFISLGIHASKQYGSVSRTR